MQNFLRIHSNANVMPLMAAIIRQPELWNQNKLRTTYEGTVHAEADDIWLRFNDVNNASANEIMDGHESIDYPAFASLPQARPLVFDLMRIVEGKRLGRVLITKLTPGKKIYPHEDSGDHASYYERYHIILQNSPGSVFRCGDEVICMKTGDVYWFNNAIEHEVINNSSDDRVTMIVDIKC